MFNLIIKILIWALIVLDYIGDKAVILQINVIKDIVVHNIININNV